MKRFAASSTGIALFALVAGTSLGLLVYRSGSAQWLGVTEYVSSFGTLWTNALRMTVIPLVVSTLIVAVAGRDLKQGIGKITGLSYLTFAALLLAGTLIVLAVLPPILSRLDIGSERPISTRSDGDSGERPARGSGFKDFIATLLPANPVKAASEDDMLAIVLFAILVGLAATKIEPQQREALVDVARGLSASMKVVIGWIIWLMPVGIFAFSFVATANVGLGTVGILGAWVGVAYIMAGILIALMYALAVLVGQVSLRAFAKSLLPAQEVAVATRSSLAALPALLDGAQLHLGRNDAVSNICLPLAVSSFKLNRVIHSVGRLLFLSLVYKVPLSFASITTFATAAALMSFASPGLPGRGPGATIPLYLAVGIPMEGIVLLRAVESLTDIGMTALNVTADMTAMTIVGRFTKQAVESEVRLVPDQSC